MEKDIGKIKKNNDTDIIIRIDEFGGKPGLTIREFVNTSPSGFKGFTKSGTRVPVESFEAFKAMINSINSEDFTVSEKPVEKKAIEKKPQKELDEEDSGIDEEGLM
jgi:hypothetical protein